MGKRIVAIVGSYRKGGAADCAVEAVLEGARSGGAETRTFYLRDEPIEFCTNCRSCMQAAGPQRGMCIQKDGLEAMLEEIDRADALVLASPVNCYNVTAVFRRWMERLVGQTYWPWGQHAPKTRTRGTKHTAVLIATSAMPGFLIPFATGAAKALRVTAQLLSAKPVAQLWIGLAAGEPRYVLPTKTIERARKIGLSLC